MSHSVERSGVDPLLKYIHDHQFATGRPPTTGEMAVRFGYRLTVIRRLLRARERDGLLVMEPARGPGQTIRVRAVALGVVR